MKTLLRLAVLRAMLIAALNAIESLMIRLYSMTPFGKLRRDRRGFKGIIIAVVSTLVLLFVAILVMTTFINSVTPDTTWSLTANTTWANVQSYSWTAIGLVAIGIIILGAVAILAIVGKMGQTGGGL